MLEVNYGRCTYARTSISVSVLNLLHSKCFTKNSNWFSNRRHDGDLSVSIECGKKQILKKESNDDDQERMIEVFYFSFFNQFSTTLTFCQMLWLTSFSIEYGDDWAITESERKCKIHFYCSEIKCEAIVCCVPHLPEWPNVCGRDTACVCVCQTFFVYISIHFRFGCHLFCLFVWTIVWAETFSFFVWLWLAGWMCVLTIHDNTNNNNAKYVRRLNGYLRNSLLACEPLEMGWQ